MYIFQRKKQVFDPSDPNTYSRSVTEKPRLSETLATKKKSDSPVYSKRARKSIPSNVVELPPAKAISSNNKGKGLRHKADSSNVTPTKSSLDSSVSDGTMPVNLTNICIRQV